MNAVMQQLVGGQLTAVTIVVWVLVAGLLSIVAGALAAIQLGGKDLGNGLAGLMGAMYGPVAAVPGVLIALIVLVYL